MEISAISISNSGQLIAMANLERSSRNCQTPHHIMELRQEKPVAVLRMQVCVKKLAFSPDDRFLAALGENNTFIIWDTRDAQLFILEFSNSHFMLSVGVI